MKVAVSLSGLSTWRDKKSEYVHRWEGVRMGEGWPAIWFFYDPACYAVLAKADCCKHVSQTKQRTSPQAEFKFEFSEASCM